MRIVQREWEYRGLKCLVAVDEEIVEEWYSGYVAVPREHPDWGKNHTDVEVHGGLDFAQQGLDDSIWKGKELWWLGFNCAQATDDTVKGRLSENPYLDDGTSPPLHKWTLDEVVAETEKLAEQLIKHQGTVR